jgi:hypothetical protein
MTEKRTGIWMAMLLSLGCSTILAQSKPIDSAARRQIDA